MKSEFRVGQRWLSVTEPELGLGIVGGVGEGRVTVRYPAVDEVRQYVQDGAPLRRLVLRQGETARHRDGREWVVERVESRGGVLSYVAVSGEILCESDLEDALNRGGAESRLLAAHAEPTRDFDLRRDALRHQHRRRRSPVRGYMGGRMDLIPHQLFIAREVTSRLLPRVLLADEVGLGKTVEACLIIHRLLATGRAARVMVVVPESLVHQWFVELLRRFNLWFHIFDEERCDAIEGADPGCNPFLEDQWLLCSLALLRDPKRATQAAAAGWDLLVVDEAHHLGWAPEQPSPDYLVVEGLAKVSEGLLLLTATPEQLGVASHFARLRLLDPHRFYDLRAFEEESGLYVRLAALATRLLSGKALGSSEAEVLHQVLGGEPEGIRRRLEVLAAGDVAARDQLVQDLLDRHGTGRVMFRNTRAAMRGFPKRKPIPQPLDAPGESCLESLAAEFDDDQRVSSGSGKAVSAMGDLRDDPRLVWLADLLRRLKTAKVLLICRSQEKVLAIEAALRQRITVKVALFHESLELIQRDRNAAWFADPEGAQILLASEIGSEGRNFQFAHHLVLFDLPLDPELLEQRIGRLDRIGQTSEIQIHVPYVRASAQEVVFRWYHEGCDALGRNSVAGRALRERFEAAVRDLALDFHETHETRREDLEALIRETAAYRVALEAQLEQGRDRLLELNSFHAPTARTLVGTITEADRDTSLDEFLLRVWDHFGVPVEDLGPRLYRLGGDGVYSGEFPSVPEEGVIATMDRRAALGREDIAFLTWDHPMVTGALDMLLGSTAGNVACATWPRAGIQGVWLETLHVLEPVASPKLHVDRFLPGTPIQSVVDAQGRDVSMKAAPLLAKAPLKDRPINDLLEAPGVRDLVTELLEVAGRRAETEAETLRAAAIQEMERDLGHELERLRALAAVNRSVSAAEIGMLETQRETLRERIAGARIRLDAVRLVVLAER